MSNIIKLNVALRFLSLSLSLSLYVLSLNYSFMHEALDAGNQIISIVATELIFFPIKLQFR